MHKKYTAQIGKWLMRKGALKIAIIDDEDAYFNKKMLSSAQVAGFCGIERHKKVNEKLYQKLLSEKYDIVILDVKGSTEPTVSKDGLELAKNLKQNTSSYIVITSAHQFHLSNQSLLTDYVIEQRTLTSVDFINELRTIIANYLSQHLKFYKKVSFRFGFFLLKHANGVIH